MPSPTTAPRPEAPDASGPAGPVGRTAAALLRRLRSRQAPARQPAVPPSRLALDLDDCRRARERWQRHAESYERELTRVSRERAHLLAWLAALHPASAVITPAAEAGPDGTHLLRLVAGGRQLSWRLPPTHLPLFTHVSYREPAGTPLCDDSRPAPDQAAHIRRHTRLLALEGGLFPAPAERRSPPARPGDR